MQAKLRSYRYALERAGSISGCWKLIVEAMRQLGFDHVELVLPGGARHHAWLHGPDVHSSRGDCWTRKIPLGEPAEGSWMQLSRHIDRGEGYLMLHAVVETVREILPQKILEEERRSLPRRQ